MVSKKKKRDVSTIEEKKARPKPKKVEPLTGGDNAKGEKKFNLSGNHKRKKKKGGGGTPEEKKKKKDEGCGGGCHSTKTNVQKKKKIKDSKRRRTTLGQETPAIRENSWKQEKDKEKRKKNRPSRGGEGKQKERRDARIKKTRAQEKTGPL